MANQRWSVDKNIKLIIEYQRKECLWDPKHPQYKNRDAREAAYKAIKETMEMDTVKEVVRQIRILRNTYNNELLKAKRCNTTGMGTDEVYVSKIQWLSHMDFLKNIDSCTRENTEYLTLNITPNTQEASVSESNDEEITVPRTPSRNKRKLKDPLLRAVTALEKVSSQLFSNNSGDDEFDLFGRTIAHQLRQLPLEAALETEEVILATIRRQRIKLLKQTSLSQRGISSMSECMKSNRTITITIPENQQVAQSSSESESIASTSAATNNDAEDEYYTYNDDIPTLASCCKHIRFSFR